MPSSGPTELLQKATFRQVPERGRREAQPFDQARDLGIGSSIIAGQKHHAVSALLLWIGGRNGSGQCIKRLDHRRAAQLLLQDRARRATAEINRRIENAMPVKTIISSCTCFAVFVARIIRLVGFFRIVVTPDQERFAPFWATNSVTTYPNCI